MTVLHICCNLAGSTVFPQLFEALAAQGLDQVVFVPEKRAADLGKNEPRGVKTIRAMTVRQSDALFFFRKAQRSVPAMQPIPATRNTTISWRYASLKPS